MSIVAWDYVVCAHRANWARIDMEESLQCLMEIECVLSRLPARPNPQRDCVLFSRTLTHSLVNGDDRYHKDNFLYHFGQLRE